jgi:methylglutaconyl-CoA hydratase
MSWQCISVETSARGIASLTLNRPDRGNRYDDVMLSELVEVLGQFAGDDRVRVVVVRGTGKHFCVGADVGGQRAAPAAATQKPRADLVTMLTALDALPKPTIAVLHGGCLGGGVGLAACCDIALAQEDAFFAIPEVRLGLTPTSLLPIFLRAIEYRAFRRYGLSGERFSAAEAMRVGLVHQVCPAEALEATVATVVEELLHSAPGAVASLKKSAARLVAQPLAVEAAAAGPRSPETAEGIAAFLEKRKPSWYPKP